MLVQIKKKALTTKSGQVRELGREDIRNMRAAQEVLPADLLDVLPKRQVGNGAHRHDQIGM